MTTEVKSQLIYHATFLLEILGNLFLRLNRLVWLRFRRNPTNNVALIHHPNGVTDDVFRNMYGAVLIFKRYDETRILDYTPVTTGRPGRTFP
jgi:hypothetical protein